MAGIIRRATRAAGRLAAAPFNAVGLDGVGGVVKTVVNTPTNIALGATNAVSDAIGSGVEKVGNLVDDAKVFIPGVSERRAADAMAGAARNQLALDERMYNEGVARVQPYAQAGLAGLAGGFDAAQRLNDPQMPGRYQGPAWQEQSFNLRGWQDKGDPTYAAYQGQTQRQQAQYQGPGQFQGPARQQQATYQTPAQQQQAQYQGLGQHQAQTHQAAAPWSGKDLGQDAGYQFRKQEGLAAVSDQAAAGGGQLSGATEKARMKYASGLASQEAGAAYGRFSDQRESERRAFDTDRQFGRQSYDKDRRFGRQGYESDRNFGRQSFAEDRNFGRQSFAEDRNYNQGAFERQQQFDRQGYDTDRQFGRQSFAEDRNYDQGTFERQQQFDRQGYDTDRQFSEDLRRQRFDEQLDPYKWGEEMLQRQNFVGQQQEYNRFASERAYQGGEDWQQYGEQMARQRMPYEEAMKFAGMGLEASTGQAGMGQQFAQQGSQAYGLMGQAAAGKAMAFQTGLKNTIGLAADAGSVYYGTKGQKGG